MADVIPSMIHGFFCENFKVATTVPVSINSVDNTILLSGTLVVSNTRLRLRPPEKSLNS